MERFIFFFYAVAQHFLLSRLGENDLGSTSHIPGGDVIQRGIPSSSLSGICELAETCSIPIHVFGIAHTMQGPRYQKPVMCMHRSLPGSKWQKSTAHLFTHKIFDDGRKEEVQYVGNIWG